MELELKEQELKSLGTLNKSERQIVDALVLMDDRLHRQAIDNVRAAQDEALERFRESSEQDELEVEEWDRLRRAAMRLLRTALKAWTNGDLAPCLPLEAPTAWDAYHSTKGGD